MDGCPHHTHPSHHDLLQPPPYPSSPQVNTSFDGLRPNDPVTVNVVFLTSYEHMGSAAVSCVKGCTCRPVEVNAHRTEKRVSLLDMAPLETLEHSPECHVKIEVLPKSTSGEHKVGRGGVGSAGARDGGPPR